MYLVQKNIGAESRRRFNYDTGGNDLSVHLWRNNMAKFYWYLLLLVFQSYILHHIDTILSQRKLSDVIDWKRFEILLIHYPSKKLSKRWDVANNIQELQKT